MSNKRAKMPPGARYGKLTIIKEIEIADGQPSRFLCKCDCGNESIVRGDTMRRGGARSCGCIGPAKRTIHGMSREPLYNIWTTMKARCLSTKSKAYPIYGKRGITICDEWKENYPQFKKWAIEQGYKKGLTLERIDNNGPYNPQNCTWASRTIQANNRRNNRLISFNGKTLTMAQWSKRTGIKQHTLRRRIVAGWPIDEALSGELRKDVKYSFDGKSQPLKEWAAQTKIGYSTLRNRLNSGWSIEKTLTKPTSKQSA